LSGRNFLSQWAHFGGAFRNEEYLKELEKGAGSTGGIIEKYTDNKNYQYFFLFIVTFILSDSFCITFKTEEKSMDICEVVGQRLRELRKLKGLSQEKMAEQAGVNAKYYSEIERGKRNITLKVMEKIADNLGISIKELFRFPGQETFSVCGEEVVALIISALKSKDEEMLRKIKIFLTEILGCSL